MPLSVLIIIVAALLGLCALGWHVAGFNNTAALGWHVVALGWHVVGYNNETALALNAASAVTCWRASCITGKMDGTAMVG